jgi:hypothetical protein
VYLRLVAGDRNVLKIPTIPFSFDILRPAAWLTPTVQNRPRLLGFPGLDIRP